MTAADKKIRLAIVAEDDRAAAFADAVSADTRSEVCSGIIDNETQAVLIDTSYGIAANTIETCLKKKLHVMFAGDPVGLSNDWEDVEKKVSAAGLTWTVGIPEMFTAGFLKWFTLIKRGQIGKPQFIRVVLSCFPPEDENKLKDAIGSFIRTPAFILERFAGDVTGVSNAGTVRSEYTRKWFEWNGVFGGGVFGAIELTAPVSKRTVGKLAVSAFGDDGELRLEIHDGRESLRYQKQEFIRTLDQAPVPRERVAVRAFLDFVSGGIEPFVSLRNMLAAGKVAQRVLSDLDRPTGGKKLKVLFVNPPRYRVQGDRMYAPSLGTARMTAYMREFGFEAHQEDLDILCAENGVRLDPATDAPHVSECLKGRIMPPEMSEFIDKIMSLSGAAGYDVVGFSIVDFYGRFQLDVSLLLAWKLKKLNPNIKIVFGGVADEIRPRETLADYPGLVDFVIAGDGETAMLELCDSLEFGDRPHSFVRNLIFKDNGTIVGNRQELLPLKFRPCPTFDDVPLDLYKKPLSPEVVELLKKDSIEISGAASLFYLPYYNIKGCAYKCVFCGFGNFLDMQKPEKTVRELKNIVDRYGTRHFMFWNTTINMNYKYCNEFCDAIIDSGLDILWTDSARPQFFDEALAAKMARAGCILLNFGLESASDKMLGIINKGFTGAEAAQALRTTHNAGIINRVNLIAGFFHETTEDVAITCDFLDKNAEFIDMIGCFNGFYLNEGVMLDEERIKVKLLGRKEVIFTGQESIAYDEIDGYNWDRKKEAIRYSRETILKKIEEKGIFYETAIREYDLFILYDYFRDIKKVKKYLFASTMKSGCRDE